MTCDEARATVGLRSGDVDALAYHTERGRVHDSTEGGVARRRGRLVGRPPPPGHHHHRPHPASRSRHQLGDRRPPARVPGRPAPLCRGEGDTTIRVGDTVTTRRNNRRIVASDGQWIRNGDRWEVTGTTPDGQITARRVGGSATVTLPNRYTDEHVQLGYATTQTRVQSLTVDAALCAVTHTSRRNQLYVGMTRGRGRTTCW